MTLNLNNELKDSLAAATAMNKLLYDPQGDLYAEAAKAAKRQNAEAERVRREAEAKRNTPPGQPGVVTPTPPNGGVPMAPPPPQPGQQSQAGGGGAMVLSPPPVWPLSQNGTLPGQGTPRVARGGPIRSYRVGGGVRRYQAGGSVTDDDDEADLILRSLLSRGAADIRRQNPDDAALITNAPGDPTRLEQHLTNMQLNQDTSRKGYDPAYDWEVSAQPERQRNREADWGAQERDTQAFQTNQPFQREPPPPRSLVGRALDRAGRLVNPDPILDYDRAAQKGIWDQQARLQPSPLEPMTDEQLAARQAALDKLSGEGRDLERQRFLGGSASSPSVASSPGAARAAPAGGPASRPAPQMSTPTDPDAIQALTQPKPGPSRGLPQGPLPSDRSDLPPGRPGVGIVPANIPPGAAPPVQPPGNNGPVTAGNSGPSGTTASPAPPIARPAAGSLGDQSRTAAFDPSTETGIGAVDASGRDIRALNTGAPPVAGATASGPISSGQTGIPSGVDLSSNNAARDLAALPRILNGVREVARSISPNGPPPVGHGAVKPATLGALVQQNNGQGRFSPGSAMLRGMTAAYLELLNQGKVDEANKMAYGIVQAANYQISMHGNTALELLRNGDVRTAAAHVAAGADWAPDGMNHTLSPDGRFILTSDASGKLTGRTPADGRWILAAATGMQNGSMMWQSLNAAASMVPMKANPEGRAMTNQLKAWQIELIKQRIAKMRADPKNAGISDERLGIMALAQVTAGQGGGQQARPSTDSGEAIDSSLLGINADAGNDQQ